MQQNSGIKSLTYMKSPPKCIGHIYWQFAKMYKSLMIMICNIEQISFKKNKANFFGFVLKIYTEQ